jgi:hypothetical protein
MHEQKEIHENHMPFDSLSFILRKRNKYRSIGGLAGNTRKEILKRTFFPRRRKFKMDVNRALAICPGTGEHWNQAVT